MLFQERLDEGFNNLCKITGLDEKLVETNMSIIVHPEDAARIKETNKYSEQLHQANLNKKLKYNILRSLVENNYSIKRKIKKIYNKDFVMYEKASLVAF